MSTIDKKIRYHMKKKGYETTEEIAKALGITRISYLYLTQEELFVPFGDFIESVAEFLGITVDELLEPIPTAVYSDSIPKEVADTISRKAEEVKQQYIRDCLEMYSHYRKKVQE